jgi:N-acetyl sugar amidotransferase
MIRCKKCNLPETHETITFDDNGVCNICLNQDKRDSIDWAARKKSLDELISQYKGKGTYDCMVPFSGGKDSTWTLYYLVKEYGLNPLVVQYDHGFMRQNLQDNVKKVSKELGVDVLSYRSNWKTVRKLMLQSFIEKGDFCWHCHTGIFAYPMWIALEKKIPLIFWGEPSAEYTAYYSYDDEIETVDETRFNRFQNLGITAEDMYIRLDGSVKKRDLQAFTYPPLNDLKALGYRSVCLGSYIKWNVKKQSQIIMDELGWTGDEVENVPPEYGFEKIECYMQGVRDYIKYIKRGYTRPSHLSAIDLRHDKISHEKAMNNINEYEGKRPPSLDIFLEYLGLNEDEFYEIASSHKISPWQFDRSKISPGKKTHDFDSWERYSGMPRKETEAQLIKWKEITS